MEHGITMYYRSETTTRRSAGQLPKRWMTDDIAEAQEDIIVS